MQFLKQLLINNKYLSSNKLAQQQTQCNYADNYYGDQVCRQKSTD